MIDKYIQTFKSRGPKTQEGFEIEKTMEGRIARDQNTENAMLQIDKIGGNIVKNAKKLLVIRLMILLEN